MVVIVTFRDIICAIMSPMKNPIIDDNDFVTTGLTLKFVLYFRHMGDSDITVESSCKAANACCAMIFGSVVTPSMNSLCCN